jgi:hypothetical protein
MPRAPRAHEVQRALVWVADQGIVRWVRTLYSGLLDEVERRGLGFIAGRATAS